MKSSLKDLYSVIRQLKLSKRKGWVERKLDADSIAEHTFGAIIIGWYIAESEGVDIDRVIRILVVHDLVMAKMKDVTPKSGGYDQKREMEEKAKHKLAEVLPGNLKPEYLKLFEEYNKGISKEAVVAREADKLETLFQGITFEEETNRNDVIDEEFFNSYSKTNYSIYFKTKTGKKLFEEIKLHKGKIND